MEKISLKRAVAKEILLIEIYNILIFEHSLMQYIVYFIHIKYFCNSPFFGPLIKRFEYVVREWKGYVKKGEAKRLLSLESIYNKAGDLLFERNNY